MIRLDATNRKLQAVLGGAITTNQLPISVSYSDKTATTYTGAMQLTNTNNTTQVDICAAPAASTVRDIDYISIKNRDTADATVTILYDDNGTDYYEFSVTLAVGDQAVYTHGSGWQVLDLNGKIKTSATASNSINSYGSRGINCFNNSGTPNTQYDMDADEIVLRDSSGNGIIRINPGSAITNNVSTAGPAANGRDQSGAFSASSWIHFYWIWDGTTLATISSATAPPTGPTLPAGYTYWAYAGAVYFNGSSQLLKVYIRGNTCYYQNRTDNLLVNGGSATVETAVSLTTAIPPNALSALCDGTLAISGSTTGTVDTVDLRIATGVNYLRLGCSTSTQASPDNARSDVFCLIPNVSQNIYYIITKNTAGGTTLFTFIVEGYTVPNGS